MQHQVNGSPATAFISTIIEDKMFSLKRLHNHPVRPSDNEVKELRNVLGDKSIQHSTCSYSARTIYIESIVRQLLIVLLFSVNILIINKSYNPDFIF